MKIPAIPQVLFDEFPSDDNTKICIFTQPKYPVPDLRKFVGKTLLFCTELNTFFMLNFAKKLPLELFQLLPDKESQWITFENTNISGLNTSFAVACIPTGSVIGSIMLLIYILDKPNELILYTGSFKECHTVLLSNMLLKFKRKIHEVYFDSTMAGSQHNDVAQINRACDDMKKIIEEYPDYRIHLQMDSYTFDSLDLLVNLARRHRINVKLSELQQIFIYRTQYRHLFELDAKALLARGKDLNVNFQFKDRPKVFVKSVKTFDAFTYKKRFEEDKIINIRLIPCTESSIQRFKRPIISGVFCVNFISHAGACTLKGLFDAVKPNRVHPINMNNEPNESWSTIPENILNVDCEIISGSKASHNCLEVNLEDINRPNRSNRSFLDASTLVSGTASNKTLSDPEEHASIPKNSDNNEPVAGPTNDSSESFDEDVAIAVNVTDEVIEIHDSDSDSDCLELMAPKTSNKRRSDSTLGNNDSKIFKSENSSTAVNIHSSENSIQMKAIEDDNYSFSSDSDCELIFPD